MQPTERYRYSLHRQSVVELAVQLHFVDGVRELDQVLDALDGVPVERDEEGSVGRGREARRWSSRCRRGGERMNGDSHMSSGRGQKEDNPHFKEVALAGNSIFRARASCKGKT